ncbi:MAG TPA: alpha/beta hydrolase [Candidatus Angelobacter sp.]|nr:alpha/beta hydrolase [Candidatus Angelobacter sp.]
MKKILNRMLLVLVALYLGFALFAYFLSDSMIFLPHPSSYRDSPEVLKITTASGKKISALYLPNPAARYTLLVSHGNAEDLGDDHYWLEDLRRAGFSIFAYDYEGYGTSEGKPSERAAYEDEAAAYDYLAVILKTEPDRIIIFGRSVGTGPATYIAAKRPSAGLILQSPFVSAFRVLTKIPLLPFDKFPNGKYIRHVHTPVFIMHSHGDSVIPFWHGQKMFDLANAPKQSFWVRNADHNDMDMVKDYYPAIQSFAATLEKGKPHPLPSVPAPKMPEL